MSSEQRGIVAAARQVIGDSGRTFVQRLSVLYAEALERAIRTMYVNQRPALSSLSADTLMLIDDETVNRQIEIDRLVARLRDMDPLSLGRLNVLIAQLHGEAEVRERENPFRPYLLARVLHDGIGELVPPGSTATLLFEKLARRMPDAFAGFYPSLYSVFESGGVQARLQAVPSRFANTATGARAQRASGFVDSGFGGDLPSATPGADPAVVRRDAFSQMLAAMSSRTSDSGTVLSSRLEAALGKLPEPLRKRLWQDRAVSGSPEPLIQWLDDCRLRVLELPPGPLPDRFRLAFLRRSLPGKDISEAVGILLDLVAAVFERIEAETSAAPAMRDRLMRLELPFLWVALHTPDLLLDPMHPLRGLIDRLGAIGPGLRQASPVGDILLGEADQAVQALLDPERDTAEWAPQCLLHFQRCLSERLPEADSGVAQCIAELARLQAALRIRAPVAAAMHEALASSGMPSGALAFLCDAFARAMAYRRTDAVLGSGASTVVEAALKEDAATLAELIWSLQPKTSLEEKDRLRQQLPALVKRTRLLLEQGCLPADTLQQSLQQLMEAHGRILREPLAKQASSCVEDFRLWLAAILGLVPADGPAQNASHLSHSALTESDIAGGLAVRGLDMTLYLSRHIGHGRPDERQRAACQDAQADIAWLVPGVGVTQNDGGAEVPVRLVWADADRRFYLFLPEFGGPPILYADQVLREAFAQGLLVPYERLPLMDRVIGAISGETAVPA